MAKGRMSALEKELKVSQAKSLFIKGFALTAISEIIKVTVKTIAKWRDDNNWEEEKDLNSLKPSVIKNMTLKCAVAIQEGRPLPYNADQISKIVSAFDKVTDARKKAVYAMETGDLFSNFLIEKAAKQTNQKRDLLLEFLQENRVYFDEFITELLLND